MAVNNPRDEPQIERFGTSLPYGREIYVSLYPEILLAEEDAKDIGMVSNSAISKTSSTPNLITQRRRDEGATSAMTAAMLIWSFIKSIPDRTAWRNASLRKFTKNANVLKFLPQVTLCLYIIFNFVTLNSIKFTYLLD